MKRKEAKRNEKKRKERERKRKKKLKKDLQSFFVSVPILIITARLFGIHIIYIHILLLKNNEIV